MTLERVAQIQGRCGVFLICCVAMALDNWCEYVGQDGEIRNILQVCCECEDIDETFTNLISSRPHRDAAAATGRTDSSRWERIVTVAQDRSRIPWPGGAKRVDLAWFASAVLLRLVRWKARRSTSFVETVVTLIVCFGMLGFSHIRALRRRSNAQFHVAWLALSLLGSYLCYLTKVQSGMPWTADAIAHVALFFMVACYLHCCLADPGRDGALEDEHCSPDERRKRCAVLRAGRCSICRSTFRLRDHHCVWVGQCIAERNRRTFLGFLVLMSALSTWFALQLVMLQAGEEPMCKGQSSRQWRLGAVVCLAWHDVGGERVFHALYAFVAGVVAAALATQQIILVGAGLTSVELRRGYTAAVTTNDPALGMTSSHHNQPSVRSPNPSVDGSCPQQSGVLPSSRRPRIVPPVRDLFLNWRRFLAGTELSTSMQEPSVKNL